MANGKNKKTEPLLPPLTEEDYYFERGLMVFTEIYHKKRGYCCKNSCRHCPYGFKKK
ncbi:DUF5522 domain-containing protein [Emticicia sp. C21]|uniref:DUF5522 domain-containing protein n=1 Tax=Emticicia sp. C21 TaxID=2302915 RepID=UPI00286E10EF|nr:DUF5522 domain-containing protein [Emticicia sp. C21]